MEKVLSFILWRGLRQETNLMATRLFTRRTWKMFLMAILLSAFVIGNSFEGSVVQEL